MSEAHPNQSRVSVQDYLDDEPLSDIRHEYIGGQLYAMAGGTRRHNRIALNIGSDLDRALESDPCQVYMGDVRAHLRTLGDDLFYYPDIMVGCDPTDDHERYVERPSVIIEVLSDSTERIDRQEKFHAYRMLPSLSEYVLVSQDTMEITVARRDDDWRAAIITAADAVLELPSIGQSLGLARIYRGVEFLSAGS